MEEIKELELIWSVGPAKAIELHEQGYTNVEKLRKGTVAKAVLTDFQQIGLKYFEDLKQKMDRSEAENIA